MVDPWHAAAFLSDGGAMGKARAEIDISRPPDEVWAVAGDFSGIGQWMPGIESCHMDEESSTAPGVSQRNGEISSLYRVMTL